MEAEKSSIPIAAVLAGRTGHVSDELICQLMVMVMRKLKVQQGKGHTARFRRSIIQM